MLEHSILSCSHGPSPSLSAVAELVNRYNAEIVTRTTECSFYENFKNAMEKKMGMAMGMAMTSPNVMEILRNMIETHSKSTHLLQHILQLHQQIVKIERFDSKGYNHLLKLES